MYLSREDILHVLTVAHIGKDCRIDYIDARIEVEQLTADETDEQIAARYDAATYRGQMDSRQVLALSDMFERATGKASEDLDSFLRWVHANHGAFAAHTARNRLTAGPL